MQLRMIFSLTSMHVLVTQGVVAALEALETTHFRAGLHYGGEVHRS